MPRKRKGGKYLKVTAKKNRWGKFAQPRQFAALAVSLLVTVLVSAIGFGGIALYDQVQLYQMRQLRPVPAPTQTVSAAPEDPSLEPAMESAPSVIEHEGSDSNQQDSVKSEEAIQRERFAPLLEINKDVVGWITVPGTEIDLPVLQTADNQYYLNHDLKNNKNKYGVPFADFECDLRTSSNVIIYGHTFNRQTGLQFTPLKKYIDPAFCMENPVFQLETLYASQTYKIAAVYVIPGDSASAMFLPFNDRKYIDMTTEEAWQAYLDEISRRAYYTVDGFLEPGQKLVSLCTCSRAAGNNRIIVVGRLLQPGESPEVRNITVNPQPYQP